MALNPFLSMGEPAATEPTGAEELNPFMMSQPDMEEEIPIGENPFAASNPFAEWGGAAEPVAADPAPSLDIFGGAALFESVSRLNKPMELELLPADNNSGRPRPPPPPARPLPPETQTLIQSVTGQMEFTSSHLLDRIPPTRTPSPVSMRDMQSPSPTPEPELTEPELPEQPPEQPPADHLDINRNKPARPPPARPAPPPPRPAPPTAPLTAPAGHNHDDINLFDAPPTTVHVKPTTKDILSLYSTPKKVEKPFDFLSDDLPTAFSEESVPKAAKGFMDPFSTPPTEPVAAVAAAAATAVIPVSTPNPGNDDVAMEVIEVTDAIDPETSPFYEVRKSKVTPEVENYKNPFGVTSDFANAMDENETCHTSAFDTSQNIFGSAQSNVFETMQTEDAAVEDTRNSEGAAWPAEHAHAAWPTAAAPAPAPTPAAQNLSPEAVAPKDDVFDAFAAKFDSTAANHISQGAWGDDAAAAEPATGFEAEAFDPFLSMSAPPAPPASAPPAPAATPRLRSQGSCDSPEDNFTLFIRPKENSAEGSAVAVGVPALAPPPRPQALPESPRANPFDRAWGASGGAEPADAAATPTAPQSATPAPPAADDDSGPPTPLFDDDVSMPLEDFPRTKYLGPGWEMHLRQPNKKKITGQRFWKKVFVRLVVGGETPVLQLLKTASEREPFQELPLQACYSVSDVAAQQFDQFGKIFTVKLQYVFYKERPGVRPGQVTKAERITNKLSQFAAYAIQGDYQGVKEFGSDLRKLGLPVEHAPQVSQLFKLGSLSYEDVKQFSCCVEEALFRLAAHRDRALTYKLEEVQITVVDELYVEQDAEGSINKQIARVRLFFLGFLSGMPDVELGVNDLRRQGREVVGRHDIIPVVTEEWIRVEDTEFHACVQPEDFHKTQIIKFKPPDACYIELMRFRVRPPKNRELPLQLKAVWCVNGTRVELRADVLVPGFASRKLGQIPCEDVSIRFPIPECWIYLFRVEKHFRYGSVKSAHRRTGKIKGIERFLGAVDTLQESLIEVTSGQAKYEHQHRAIVWRMPRLPKEGQGAYTTHNLVCRMALTSFDQVPAELARHATVEFTMPATQVSHTTVRSVSLQEHDSDPPEKYVRYLARHEYIVGIERTSGQEAPAYSAAVRVATAAPAHAPALAAAPAPALPAVPAAPSSDSDSD